MAATCRWKIVELIIRQNDYWICLSKLLNRGWSTLRTDNRLLLSESDEMGQMKLHTTVFLKMNKNAIKLQQLKILHAL